MTGIMRGALAAVAIGGAVVAVSACGPGDVDAGGTSTTPPASTSDSSTSSTSDTSSAPAPGSSESQEPSAGLPTASDDPSVASAPECVAGDLTGEVIESAGQRPDDELFRLTFTANGDPCRLSGFPAGLTFLDASGARLAVRVNQLGTDQPPEPVLVTKNHPVESIVFTGGKRHDVQPARVDFDLHAGNAAAPRFSLDWPAPIGPEVNLTPIANPAG